MSRKYLNDRWCVRCSKCSPTPYLRDNLKIFQEDINYQNKNILDVGCGNGRNSKYMLVNGFENVKSLDMSNDFGEKCTLGKDNLPVVDNCVDIILCNYLLMFLNKEERENLIKEFLRVANNKCFLMVELYPAKDSYFKDNQETLGFQKELYDDFIEKGWEKIKYSKNRFIIRNTGYFTYLEMYRKIK